MAGLLSLQAFWINKYYHVMKNGFQREANFAFEAAIRAEFSKRSDSIEQLISKKLADTSSFVLSSRMDKALNKLTYTITSRKKPGDSFSATLNNLPPGLSEADPVEVRAELTRMIANNLRNDDLENHVIYYRTQELGGFMLKTTNEIQFDTARLRPVLDSILQEREIAVPYVFFTTGASKYVVDIYTGTENKFPVTTRYLPTYRTSPGQQYVRVAFEDPHRYILSGMWVILLTSGLLVCAIGLCMFLLLKRLYQEKKLSKIKNDFIGNITHEFQTPIAAALIAVEALNNPAVMDDRPKAMRYVNHAKNELHRISNLTGKILNISLYENRKDVVKKERFNVAHVINELIGVKLLTGIKVEIEWLNDSGVNELTADKSQFTHALSNVIDNSIKYGGDMVEIRIKGSLDNGFLVISVQDNGPGIATDDIPFIFDKFYRSATNGRQDAEGFGLGLFYVKQIMELHRGWCRVESRQGTIIKLGWPV